jgi:exodeoxyribonuclease V gamma subunit
MAVLAYQSDRVEDLVERLIVELERDEDRRSSSARDRLFLEHLVVIPTRNLETYLTLEIAARRGVATGVRFVTIQRLLSDLLPVDDAGEPRVEILDQASLTRLMVSVLSDETLLAEPEMRPVRDFLYPDLAVDEDHERRRFQLAFRVARLFEDYGYSRRSLLDRWGEGKSGLDEIYGAQNVTDAHREIEAWQRRAWQALFGDDGVLERDDTTYMTLPAAIYAFADELSWPEVTHVFGQSYLPRFFRDLFSTQTYEESRQINFYVMNPCLEHWSHGVAGDRDEDPVFDILGDSSLLSGDEYPMALELWGRAGRDFQRLLDEVTYDRVDLGRRDERDDDTLLRCFQAMIRDLKTDREVFIDRDVPIDESLHFWSMPGIQRECEAIASEIWELVTTREDLRFNDIAVVVQPAERTVYQSHLRAAFERTGGIPCNVIDVAGEQRSPFLEAARLLLDLPLGSFRRRELLSLLVHPCVLLKYPEVSATDWMHWCDELNIFQAAGREDLAGTYLQEERFTWEQGLRRLVLGSFMSHPPDERPEPFALNGEEALVLETGHEKMESVGTFVGLVEDLIQGARAVRGHRRSLARWMEHFRDEITRHLRPRDRREERTRMRLLGRLQEIADGDLCPDDVVGYRTAFDFAATAMSEMEETLGQYLADGVVISAFKPMRPIPFEVVFVTGLGENRFPAPDPPEMLDLRQIRSRMHDVNPRHRDLYLFLETLMSTRSRLYLSWVGRHGITGDALEPASVVYQLQEMILSMTPLDEEHRSLEVREALRRRVAVVEHPLRRYHESYFPELFGEEGAQALPNHHAEAYHEARIRALRRELPPEIAS